MSFECNFCESTFARKASMIEHQKTAKYCLAVQGENLDKISCKFCGKKLSKKYLEKHQEKCDKNNGTYIHELEAKIRELENKQEKQDIHPMLFRAQKIAAERGGLCLTTEYKNSRTKMTWECGKKHVWQAKYDNVVNNNIWCIVCAGKVKYTLADCQKLAKSREGWCLATEYKNNSTKIPWKCKFLHEWNTTYSSVQQGQWCPYCYGNVRLTLEDCQKLAEYRGGKCLSTEYKNNYTSMDWQCEFGHIWKARYGDVKQGKWCINCAGKEKHTLEDAQKLAELKDGLCLSENYENSKQHMDWQCSKGHTWRASYNRVQQDHWCPNCLYKNEQKTREIFEEILQVPFPKTKGLFSIPKSELDGYSPFCGVNQDVKIGFEYQGKQHYEFVPHFHRDGPDDLDKQKERDQQKRDECEKLGIHLIEVPYDVKEKDIFIRYELIKILGTLPPHNYATIVYPE